MTRRARPSVDADQARLDLLDRALRYCTQDYDMVNATFAALDTKAQASFGVSGLFVAGTVGLLNAVAGAASISWWIVAGVLVTYALLVGAIVASLAALKVREVATPMDSAAVVSMTLDVITLPDEELTAERRANWYRDQLGEWLRVTDAVDKVNSEKARLVAAAQVMLIAAVLCAGGVTVAFGLT